MFDVTETMVKKLPTAESPLELVLISSMCVGPGITMIALAWVARSWVAVLANPAAVTPVQYQVAAGYSSSSGDSTWPFFLLPFLPLFFLVASPFLSEFGSLVLAILRKYAL
ncbi:hypothetical protein H9P43_004409 [Blastocladiella emersonii ATCC 22665]|nr:hypothetical protein H9P43_004409 [Blastocladiella emersonii ATCC 22665]